MQPEAEESGSLEGEEFGESEMSEFGESENEENAGFDLGVDTSGPKKLKGQVEIQFDFVEPHEAYFHMSKNLLLPVFDADADKMNFGELADIIVG